MRSALRRCLALACVVAGGGADVAHLERLERLERLDAWLASNVSAAPPAHWAVTAPSDVRAGSGFVLESGQKQVVASQLTGASGAQVIVKALRKAAGPFAFGDRASDIAYFELVYLEYLRGAPGVPLLHGGWETRSHVFWVTSHDGLPIATGKGTHAHPTRPPAPRGAVPRRARGVRPPKGTRARAAVAPAMSTRPRRDDRRVRSMSGVASVSGAAGAAEASISIGAAERTERIRYIFGLEAAPAVQ